MDSRFVARKTYSGDNAGSFQIWEYMVDVPGRSGGAAVRLTFKEKTFKVRLPVVERPRAPSGWPRGRWTR